MQDQAGLAHLWVHFVVHRVSNIAHGGQGEEERGKLVADHPAPDPHGVGPRPGFPPGGVLGEVLRPRTPDDDALLVVVPAHERGGEDGQQGRGRADNHLLLGALGGAQGLLVRLGVDLVELFDGLTLDDLRRVAALFVDVPDGVGGEVFQGRVSHGCHDARVGRDEPEQGDVLHDRVQELGDAGEDTVGLVGVGALPSHIVATLDALGTAWHGT